MFELRDPVLWRAQEAAHVERADALTRGALTRRARGQVHPVEDFLFRYYRFRPGLLRRWHPGPGVALLGDDPAGRGAWPHYRHDGSASSLDVRGYQERRGAAVAAVRELLLATASRPPFHGCFGLHEWAMVYGLPADEVRHVGWPLRLGRRGTDEVVRSRPLHCSHYDAYRFFTPAARPLNRLAPAPERRAELEQPGCLHAGMDLYRFAYRLSPAVPSELVLDCFAHARDAREVDMRASPYDLRTLGYDPIAVETAAGRAEYVAQQTRLTRAAAPLRARLTQVCERLLTGA